MDIERTMQFILNSQAKAEARADRAEARSNRADARMDRAEVRMDRAEVRMDRAEARMDRAEKKAVREMATIRRLLQQGMKALAELTVAQKETDRTLRAFLKSSRNGGTRNGH